LIVDGAVDVGIHPAAAAQGPQQNAIVGRHRDAASSLERLQTFLWEAMTGMSQKGY
jgi:hypothetical protein